MTVGGARSLALCFRFRRERRGFDLRLGVALGVGPWPRAQRPARAAGAALATGAAAGRATSRGAGDADRSCPCGAGVCEAGACRMNGFCTADAIIGAGLKSTALVSPRMIALVARSGASGTASAGDGSALGSGKRSATFCEAVSPTVRNAIACQLPMAYPTIPAARRESQRARLNARLRRIRTPPSIPHPTSRMSFQMRLNL